MMLMGQQSCRRLSLPTIDAATLGRPHDRSFGGGLLSLSESTHRHRHRCRMIELMDGSLVVGQEVALAAMMLAVHGEIVHREEEAEEGGGGGGGGGVIEDRESSPFG